jgi:creatinine amidohydrolase
MASRFLLQDLTREGARNIAAETLALFPVGATEQHGPHLPVGTDLITVEYIAREAATRAMSQVPIVVTPTMPFGSSHHHLPFGGTMSLSTEAYYRAIYELTESLIIDGFRRIFILNGHGGNHEIVQLVARDLALKHPVNIGGGSYWTISWDALVQVKGDTPGGLPGHAGAFETSQMLMLRGELVRQPLPHREDVELGNARGFSPYRGEVHGSWLSMNGYTDSPDLANAQRGRAYLEATVRSVADALITFYRVGLA